MRRSRWLPALGLVASVALVWSLTAGVLWQADSASALLDDKYTQADRLLFYRVDAGSTLNLQVPAGAEAVRVVSHLVIPGEAPWSPDRQHLYGLGVRLGTEDGQTVAEGPLFTRTRQSKADRHGATWLREAAFSPRADTQLGDEREFFLEVPLTHRDQPLELALRYPAQEGAVLLRVYAKFERGRSMLKVRNAARLEQATARADRSTFLWWDKLDERARQRLLDETWERLDPRGDPSREFATEPVYRTGFRLPWTDAGDVERERLPAGRAVALNVMGPARLDLWLWKELGAGSAPPGPVTVATFSLEAVEHRLDVPVPHDEAARQTLEVPAGVHTVTVRNVGSVDLRFAVEGPRWAQLRAVEREPGPSRAQLPAVTRVSTLGAAAEETQGPSVPWLPDFRRTEVWATGPGCAPLELELPGASAEELARLLRVDARLLSPEVDPAATQPAPVIRVALVDGSGEPVGEAEFGGASGVDPFESAVGPPRAVDAVPCVAAGIGGSGTGESAGPQLRTVELTSRPFAVGEPLSARVLAPSGARRILVQSTHPVAISLYAFLSSSKGAQLEAPYRDHTSEPTRWRNAPYSLGHWHLLRPGNHRALAESGAALTLLSQVRLEPAGPGSGEGAGTPVTIYPAGAPMSREIVELDSELGDDARGADPLRGIFTRLQPNQKARVRFEGRTPSRPELRVDVDDPAALGADVRIRVDGTVVKRFRLRTARTRELLPPVKPGVRELVIESDAPGVTALLNRGPAGGSDALRVRTVYRVGDGLRVPVKKRGPGPATLNIVVYTPEPDASEEPRLRVMIDGGKPVRLAGVLTPRVTRAERELSWPSSRKPAGTMTGAHKGAWYPRTVKVTLGEDLPAGTHWVTVRAMEGAGPAWARFFVYDGAPEPQPDKRWSRPGWDVEDGP